MNNTINESTGVYTNDGTQVAVRSWRKDGPRVTMLVTKDDWEQLKDQRAYPENDPTMIATAGSIIDDWKKSGAEIYWKTAADYNKEARDLENHRFRNNPDVSANFDAGIDSTRGDAHTTMKNNLRAVESMKDTFKEYLKEYDVGDRQLQQQHTQQQQAAVQDAEARGGAFQKQMGATPQAGDVLETPAGRFLVLGGSMEGLQVKKLGAGGGKTITVPHGTKFKAMGQAASGKNVFSIVE